MVEYLPTHSWVEVSQRALLHNIRAHRSLIGREVKLMAVVKSNAYGHGAELVARVCQASGQVDWLGVASLTEARLIRQAGVSLPILVLSYFRPFNSEEMAWGIRHQVSFTVYELEQLAALEIAAQKAKRPAKVHLKLDTGMARLGLVPREAKEFLHRIQKSKYLQLAGVMSHFATAEAKNQSFLQRQLLAFMRFTRQVALPAAVLRHIACTAAITAASKTHQSLVRLGIGLYGLWPSAENKQVVSQLHPGFNLHPALAWKTQVVAVRYLPKGTPVGYDRTYITKKPTVMAVLPVGYWDGYDRRLSNRGLVIIRGIKCPIIGRICMNIAMVDASAIPNVKVGNEVILLGRQGRVEVSADTIAAQTKTINYEIVTRINPLLNRQII